MNDTLGPFVMMLFTLALMAVVLYLLTVAVLEPVMRMLEAML
jgi:hypothetical protein